MADNDKKTAKPKLLEEDFSLNIMITQDFLVNQIMHLFKEHGLSSPAQYNVLRILRGAGPGGLPSHIIGERLITRVPDVTRLIDRMEKHGWVARIRCEKDRRIVFVQLTESGRSLVDTMDEPVQSFHRNMYGHLTPDEIITCNDLLLKARKAPNT